LTRWLVFTTEALLWRREIALQVYFFTLSASGSEFGASPGDRMFENKCRSKVVLSAGILRQGQQPVSDYVSRGAPGQSNDALARPVGRREPNRKNSNGAHQKLLYVR
jgi:hypothetical protein